jgi:ankyrin repeat protein
MLENTKTPEDFDIFIKTMKKPSLEVMKRANNKEIGIFSAVYLGQDNVVRELIKADPSCVNKQNRYGWTPLHYVMCIGCSDAATILMEAGADPYIQNNDQVRPMILGAKWGHRSTVNNVCKVLYTRIGADYVKKLLTTADNLGRHPLHYAAESKQHVVCDVLLGFGADPDHRDEKGQSPTFLACATGNLDTIRVVYKKWVSTDYFYNILSF